MNDKSYNVQDSLFYLFIERYERLLSMHGGGLQKQIAIQGLECHLSRHTKTQRLLGRLA